MHDMFNLTRKSSKEKKPNLKSMDLPEVFVMLHVAAEA